MVQLEISYELRSGVEEPDYDTWAREVAVPWWQNRPGFRAIRGWYTLVGGSARIVAQVDFDRWENLSSTLASAEYLAHRQSLTEFATDVQTRVLVPTGRTPV
jgi:hypothetical protein